MAPLAVIARLRPLRQAAVVTACALLWGTAQAGVDCSFSTAGVSFGLYDPTIATPNDVIGNATVTCDYISPGSGQNLTYTVQFSAGIGGSFAQRKLASGTRRLNYNLYSDAGYTQVLGNGTGGSFTFSDSVTVGPGIGNGTRTSIFPIYGRMPALQDALTGTYGDTIVVTLAF